jgi:ABC-type multidrug transport system fused ATPase/permease subunit
LDGVNADVVFGQFTAIVGPSGAGKTTFVDTLLRLHEPRTGEIRVDGRPLSDFSVSSWRQNIGYVSQDSALVDATIADNIRFGIPEAPFADVEEAARRAGADEFIRKMPAGYDTRVGDRGVQLSGGQRQRIALASALLPNPPILILDEATSALDSRLEADIMQNIVRMRGSHAIIVIAHRLSTVTNADRIYVFDEGRVVESGTWSSLIERGNLFAEMWHLQRGGKDWGGI